jgi:hypothetical protein
VDPPRPSGHDDLVMSHILIKFRDGSEKEFRDTPRSGGSYEKQVKYEGSMVIVVDEWYKEIAYPVGLVAEVVVTPSRSW